jgi:hypothetical protein
VMSRAHDLPAADRAAKNARQGGTMSDKVALTSPPSDQLHSARSQGEVRDAM